MELGASSESISYWARGSAHDEDEEEKEEEFRRRACVGSREKNSVQSEKERGLPAATRRAVPRDEPVADSEAVEEEKHADAIAGRRAWINLDWN